jgi:hypothetical protein
MIVQTGRIGHMHRDAVKVKDMVSETDNFTLLTSTVVAVKDVLGCELQDEAIILDLKSGVYYGLDPMGARLWELIQEPILVRAVCEVILDEYDVTQEQCESDICSFFEEMAVNGLVEIRK